MVKNKKDDILNENNFQIFAQIAIEKYMEKGMMLDGILWGAIIKYYNKALASQKELESKNGRLKTKIATLGDIFDQWDSSEITDLEYADKAREAFKRNGEEADKCQD